MEQISRTTTSQPTQTTTSQPTQRQNAAQVPVGRSNSIGALGNTDQEQKQNRDKEQAMRSIYESPQYDKRNRRSKSPVRGVKLGPRRASVKIEEAQVKKEAVEAEGNTDQKQKQNRDKEQAMRSIYESPQQSNLRRQQQYREQYTQQADPLSAPIVEAYPPQEAPPVTYGEQTGAVISEGVHSESEEENQSLFSILERGVQAWNQWRRTQVDVQIDLSGVNLSGRDLSGFDLRQVNLSGANLRGADLSGAQLQKADLSAADLTGADLSEAKLQEADLSWAILRGAKLAGADLTKISLYMANLTHAMLTDAILTGANLIEAVLDHTDLNRTMLNGTYLYRTVFGDVDLSRAKGLEAVKHWGPSIIGLETIARSQGRLPDAFLRGVGVQEALIPHLHSTIWQALATYFISYAHEDKTFVGHLHTDLRNNGIRCWLDPEHTKRDELGDASLLLVLSAHSLASEWIAEVVSTALAKEAQQGKRTLFPIRLDDAVMTSRQPWVVKLRAQYEIVDFTSWMDPQAYQQALLRLLSILKLFAQ